MNTPVFELTSDLSFIEILPYHSTRNIVLTEAGVVSLTCEVQNGAPLQVSGLLPRVLRPGRLCPRVAHLLLVFSLAVFCLLLPEAKLAGLALRST